MLFDKPVKILATDFFFSLNDHLDVHRQRAMLFYIRFDRFKMDEHLAFVVCRTASVKVLTANRGFKRRRCPQIKRIDGLNIIMTVKKNGRLSGGVQPFAEDDRMAAGGENLNILHPD